MPDDTDTLPIEAEAAVDTLEAQPDAEANGEQADGTESANDAQASVPDSQLQELTDAEINEALAQLRNPAFKPAKTETTAKEGDTTDTQDTDTSIETAEADFAKVKRIQIAHLSAADRKRLVRINDLTRGGMSFDEAIARVGGKPATNAEAKAPERTDTETEEPAAEAPDALTAAQSALETAEQELIDAQAAFDTEAIRAAQKKVNAANRELAKLEIRQQDAETRSATEVTQAGAKELAGVQAKVPQLSDPKDPLVATYNDLLDSLPDHMVGPGKVESVARMAWAQVYPGKPFPADIGGQEVVNPPKKSATHVAALQTGNRLGQNRIATALRTPGAERELSDDELDQLLKAARR